MKKAVAIVKQHKYFTVISIALVTLFWAIKDLFFFDEDIFVVDKSSEFMSNMWHRTLIPKLTYLLDNLIWGINPLGYHISNIFIHLANAVLATLVLKKFLYFINEEISDKKINSILILFLILFLFTPVHSEALCYILARCSLLVTLFSLLSILFFLKSQQKWNIYLLLSMFSFLLALFSYEISWSFPFIIWCISIWISKKKNWTLKKSLFVSLPYFIIFAVWFIVKIVCINKFVITDYKDDYLFNVDLLSISKNIVVMFLRNLIPPLQNTALFIAVSVALLAVCCFAVFYIYKRSKSIFYFSIVLTVITFLSFSPAIVFGIDSHDSESERFIYFSSVFALMLLAIIAVVITNNIKLLNSIIAIIIIVYSFSLFTTIGYYKQASLISKQYLQLINFNKNADKVYLVNQPAQYHGALMFRAKSRINNNVKNSITVLNEYNKYLYSNTNTEFITLNTIQLNLPVKKLKVYINPFSSYNYFFPERNFNFKNVIVVTEKGESFTTNEKAYTIIALKDSVLHKFSN